MEIIFIFVGIFMALLGIGFLLAHLHDKKENGWGVLRFNYLSGISFLIAAIFVVLGVLDFIGVITL